MPSHIFRFKQFTIHQDRCAMKIGTDGVLLGAWANCQNAQKALDIGTGTGVIALMLAQRNPALQKIDGIELDTEATQQAIENVQRSPWSDRIEIIQSPLQTFKLAQNAQYDLIISNPPFFQKDANTSPSGKSRTQARHTDSLSFEELLEHACRLMTPNGQLNVVLPYQEGLHLKSLAQNAGLHCNRMAEVKSVAHKPVRRFLLCFEKAEKEPVIEQLTIQHRERKNYTDEYIALTKDFYLKM